MLQRLARLLLPATLAGLLLSSAATASVQNLSATDLQQLVKRAPNTYLLDVRTLGEYMQKRIKGAHLIPIDQIEGRIREIPRNQPIVVYCETAVRSALVAGYLDRLGFPKVYNLTGGIMGWQVRGYPVERGGP